MSAPEREPVRRRDPATEGCAVIVGKNVREGGRACGHLRDEHEQHESPEGNPVVVVCRPCRASGIPWRKDLPQWPSPSWAGGADHIWIAARVVGGLPAFGPPPGVDEEAVG